MNRPERSYWFPSKRYGWGWGPPVRWQGSAVLAVYTMAVAAVVILFPPARAPLAFIVLTALASLLLILVRWITGEPPRWRWGGD